MRKFSEPEEAIKYAENQWKWVFDILPDETRDKLLDFNSYPRKLDNFKGHKELPLEIMAAGAVNSFIPPFNEDIMLYMGGLKEDFQDNDQPFLVASL